MTRHSAREIHRGNQNSSGKRIHGLRILLAEDNITNQQVALGILKKFGLNADIVANGAEALTALEKLAYDLVLMDVQMPEMDGFEASRRIRDPQSAVLNHNVPIIAMTANALQGDRERCLRAGMNDYVSKPINPQVLIETLERWGSSEIMQPESGENQPAPQTNLATLSLSPGDKVSIDELPVFDRKGLLHRIMDDDDLVSLLIKAFLDDLPLQIQALKDYLQAGDVAGVERQAHTIKGAAGNVSGEALRAIAYEMEKNSKSGDLESIRKRMNELEFQAQRLNDAMKEEL